MMRAIFLQNYNTKNKKRSTHNVTKDDHTIRTEKTRVAT